MDLQFLSKHRHFLDRLYRPEAFFVLIMRLSAGTVFVEAR
jgi:hypothetical protein